MQPTLVPSAVSASAPARSSATFALELGSFRGALADQAIVSTSRCVDGLLDLYNATLDPAARRLIEEVLRQIRFTSAVRGGHMLRALTDIDEAALLDHALDA